MALGMYAATDPGLTQVWVTPFLEIGDWDSAPADWSNSEAIKGKPCARFATARDGKVYTVNMVTMSIAEVTVEGLKDVYKLPPLSGTDIYGSAISLDEEGNFLIGKEFVTRPGSSLNWAVYSPKTNQAKQIVLDIPEGWTIGRIDCVGHVLGDLTRDALFFIAPETGNYTQKVRVIKVTGNGSVNSIEFETIGGVEVPASQAGQQGIAQPAFSNYAEYTAAGEDNYNFYYSGCNGVNTAYASYIDGVVTPNFAPDMPYSINSGVNGFDTFVLNGTRYFVRNYSNTPGAREMGFAVMNETGDILTTYMNTDYVPNGGYSTIVAETTSNNTANIYIYNSNGKGVQAAQLSFDPSQCGAPIVPNKPIGATPDDAYKISTPQQLTTMSTLVTASDFYVVLENDIDMADVEFKPIEINATIHFEGNNHVIKNLTASSTSSGNFGLFGEMKGEIKNLGLENVYVYTNWGCGGGFIGTAGNVTIDNCFTTGSINAAAVGGLIGAAHGNVVIKNSYSLANVNDLNNHYAGGLVGRVGSNGGAATLTVTYSYAGGNVASNTGTASGIASANQAESVVNMDYVVAWNSIVNGGKADVFCAGLSDNIELGDNYWIYDGLLLNGVVDGDDSQTTIMEEVATWDAFNSTVNNGRAVLAWETANGNSNLLGTENNPYKLYTARDVYNMRNYIAPGHSYFTVENDIDMAGVAYTAPLGDNNFSGRVVHIDGKCHVIDNFTVSSGNYPSLIGVFMGDIKNLGMTNVAISSTTSGVGVFGAFTGHASYDGITTIDNCFATGKVTGAYYAGGIGGYNNGQLKISNSYTLVEVEANAFAGGVLGWVPGGVTTIENVYAGSYVEALNEDGTAGGIINLVGEGVATLNNVVSWGEGVYGASVGFVNGGTVEVTENNVYCGENVLLNGETAPEDAKSDEDLVAVVATWEAFSDKLNEGKPMLKWQAEGTGGVNDIVVDENEANGPAVYYNLQGVKVANPENGIYIVRRGNKVTKELVR
ncbi:MAG: hypothetical protein K2J10_10005, partial [Muribaculaceae bacterium]|nr:hypothetical protein [Muribaculaceae bacterium]